jgi:hypothetical protein
MEGKGEGEKRKPSMASIILDKTAEYDGTRCGK